MKRKLCLNSRVINIPTYAGQDVRVIEIVIADSRLQKWNVSKSKSCFGMPNKQVWICSLNDIEGFNNSFLQLDLALRKLNSKDIICQT